MSEVKLAAEKRTEFGKGPSRRLRRESKVPAVLYGHGIDPIHVALPGHDTMMALKHSNQLLTIDLGAGQSQLALPKAVQRHPVKNYIEHVDLLVVRRGEKVTVEVPLHFVGESAPGTLLVTELNVLLVEVEATHIPTAIEVDVEGLTPGHRITAADVALPPGATLILDGDMLIVQATVPVAADLGDSATGDDAEAGAAGGEAAAAE